MIPNELVIVICFGVGCVIGSLVGWGVVILLDKAGIL